MILTTPPPVLGIFDVKSTYSISEGQNDFPRLVRTAEKIGIVGITRHDHTVAYLVSRDKMEGYIETMELLANPEFMRLVRLDRAGKLKYKPLSSLDE
jgi:antitoxin YefM